jgi:Nif-specific regulatory protein
MFLIVPPTSPENAVLIGVHDLLGREVALDELLAAMIDRIRSAMLADRCTLYLVDHGKGEVFSKAAHLPELPEIRLRLGQGVAGHVALSGELVNVPTAKEDARFFKGVDEKTGYRTESLLAGPVRDRAGTIVGVVQLLNKRGGTFDAQDARQLVELARQVGLAIEATTLHARLVRPAEDAGVPVPLADRFNRIIGESAPMQRAYAITTKAAASQSTVLITGESGTGKELFARALHVNSPRRDAPLVKVDCAALPSSLIENELFGHERGAYTGADQRATGKFDAAQQGTLFLDEVGELPLAVQGKLLRVLQDREFLRVGGARPVAVDVRIVAATNRDLEKMIAAGLFRADLYYRIKVVELRLPPLRARGPEEIVRLSRHFVAQASKRHGRPAPTISQPALARLAAYAWPGNVRELEHCLESAVVILDGELLLPEHLPLPGSAPLLPSISADRPAGAAGAREPAPLAASAQGGPRAPDEPVAAPPGPGSAEIRPLADVEREHILHALSQLQGNRSLAARALRIGRNTLARKLKEYGV